MPKFELVNPYIEGNFQTVYSSKNEKECAEELWNNLSGYLTGHVPKFAFTIKNKSNDKLSHFLVKENIEGDLVDYSINELNVELNKEALKQFNSKINKINSVQSGGRKHKKEEDDDSSSSDSDDELFEIYEKVMKKRRKAHSNPIVYWWYTPTIYEYVVGSVFCPTFVVPLMPLVEIYSLSSALWN